MDKWINAWINAKSIRRKYAIMQYYKNKTLKKIKKDEEPSGEHDYRRGQNGQNRGNYRGRGDRRGGRGDHRGRGRRGRGGRGRGGIIQDGYMRKDGDDDKRDRRTGQLYDITYIFLGRNGLYWVPTLPCSLFITIRNHRNHHRRMQIQNLFDDRLLISPLALFSTSFVDHHFLLVMK